MRSYQSYENLSLTFPPYLEVSTQDDVGSHHFIPNLDVVRFWEQVNCSKSSPQNPPMFFVDVFGPVLETRRRWYLLRPIGPSQGEPIPARARCADTTFQLHEADRAIEAVIMRTFRASKCGNFLASHNEDKKWVFPIVVTCTFQV